MNAQAQSESLHGRRCHPGTTHSDVYRPNLGFGSLPPRPRSQGRVAGNTSMWLGAGFETRTGHTLRARDDRGAERLRSTLRRDGFLPTANPVMPTFQAESSVWLAAVMPEATRKELRLPTRFRQDCERPQEF